MAAEEYVNVVNIAQEVVVSKVESEAQSDKEASIHHSEMFKPLLHNPQSLNMLKLTSPRSLPLRLSK